MKDTSNVRGDIFGGITAGIVAIPLALAFGVSSQLGAIYRKPSRPSFFLS